MKNFTQIKKVIFLLMFVFTCIGINAQTTTQTFTANGSWTVPPGVTSITVEAWGGGGAGGGTTSVARSTGGGGAGGSYTRNTTVAVTPGATINYTVGAGGTGASQANGNPGGTSTFSSATPVSAVGGAGGSRNTGSTLVLLNGAGAPATAGVTRNGGAGGQGTATLLASGFSGGGGGGAGSTANGANASAQNAGAGGAPDGGDGADGTNSSGDGDDATQLSGGGSGGRNGNTGSNRSGGNGYRGQIKITYAIPEIDITGNTVSITDGDTTPDSADHTDFGLTPVGTPVTRTYTIRNTGAVATLTIGAITFIGGNAGDFSVITAPAASVVAGGTTTFTVRFNPTAIGLRTTMINIVNNDTNENPYNFNIQGTAPTPEIDILGNGVSIPDGDVTISLLDDTDFAGSSVGVGITRTYTINNDGTAALTIGAITFSGTNAGDFTVITLPSASIAAGGSTTFVVRFTPGAVGTRTATISIVNNDANENPYNFNIQGTGFTAVSYGPGGVMSNLQLWLRSDLINGTTGVADGSNVATWSTQARGTDAVKPGTVGFPKYRNNTTDNINFNAVVDFQNDYNNIPINYNDNDPTRQYLKGTTGFYTQDMYVVLIPDAPMTNLQGSNDVFCGDRNSGTNETDATGFGYGRYTQRFNTEVLAYCIGTTTGPGNGYGVAHESTTTSWSDAAIINARNNSTITGTELLRNANNVLNSTSSGGSFVNVNNSRYWIGKSEGWEGSLDGKVAEVITFSNRSTDLEKSNVQSYLAIKYGITLGVNGTSMNYTNSDGNVIWDATANAGYNYDIAGIGRDDISRLTQKQSKSINPTEVMTIGLTDIAARNTDNTATFTTNKSYLTWGANGGTMIDSGVDLDIDLGPTTITTITEVVNRKWKVVETGGDVGVTRVAIPTASFLSGLPALGATDAYVMVVSTNSTFTTGLETVFMSTTGGNQTCLYDFDGTKYISFGVAHRAVNPLHITLDGSDDFVRIDNVNEISNAFTIMTWIRPNGNNSLSNGRTILAKKAAAANGYQLVLQTDNRVRMEWSVSGTTYSLITNTVIPDQKWHNIAVTYGSNILNMYIDGVLDTSSTITVAPVGTAASFAIGGQYIDKLNINNLFKGDIDELRMWNKVVTIAEIRYIMNQEILENGAGTRGTILPTTVTKNEITTLNWNNLYAYYSMNSYIGTHLDDDSYNINRGSLVIPDKVSINIQTAPMPYESTTNGAWATNATWLNGAIQDVPNSMSIVTVPASIPVDWNIVRTNHNVASNGNKVLLGMFVNSNIVSATNDSKVEVSHYLKIDGKIDLTGQSQLVQTLNSDLDPTSAGSIERDQQGQKNLYNYNYWSSPVGAINATTNNNAYTVNGVMKDGTSTTPQNITWTTGLNGNAATTPITLSNYWIFKFQNSSGTYANWSAAGQNGTLNPGQGYTLKGSNTSAASQNYTFVGKPNNGLITSTVGPGNTNLSGNPYASALDAHAFIDANSLSLNGTIYFWEHFASNNSHNLLNYQGGYAQLTKVGSTPAVTFPGLSGLGSSTKAPGRYIPVGQGFFVVGTPAGGTITFNNNQRAFFREINPLSNTLFRSDYSIVSVDHFDDNSEDVEPAGESFKKVRLGFDDHNGYHRQILMGFMNENATSGIDNGYDATHLDNQPNDMYFINGSTKLNISGEGFFDMNSAYPVSVKTDAPGTVTFKIDDSENFDESVGMYIKDNTTNIWHDIRNNVFTIDLPQGEINNRFTLRFKEENTLNTNEFSLNDSILLAYTSANNTLNIKNKLIDATVEKVELFNLLGQSISNWKITNENQQNIQLPVKSLSSGTYIVKVTTDKGDMSKKIIIN